MAESLLNKFDANGSPLAVPVSPADGVTPDAVSIQGISQLHNQYSNIGDPNITEPAYTNMGAAAMGYSNPSPSQLGQTANVYQGETNRYKNNAPENRSF
jgi:hypothetical protein|tara:strand:- start:192 stop:488 length:297 start_codon:yes stop_codon:yes gene_type:complete